MFCLFIAKFSAITNTLTRKSFNVVFQRHTYIRCIGHILHRYVLLFSRVPILKDVTTGDTGPGNGTFKSNGANLKNAG